MLFWKAEGTKIQSMKRPIHEEQGVEWVLFNTVVKVKFAKSEEITPARRLAVILENPYLRHQCPWQHLHWLVVALETLLLFILKIALGHNNAEFCQQFLAQLVFQFGKKK